MIQVLITTHTDRSELGMTPLSVAERAAVWFAYQELAARSMQFNGQSRYTLCLEFIGRKFYCFSVWKRTSDYTDPIEEQTIALIGAPPEDILNHERWTHTMLCYILKEIPFITLDMIESSYL